VSGVVSGVVFASGVVVVVVVVVSGVVVCTICRAYSPLQPARQKEVGVTPISGGYVTASSALARCRMHTE
jgi:hypothetical protein